MYPHQIPWPENILSNDRANRMSWIHSKLGYENWNYTKYHVVFVNSRDAIMYALRWSS